MLHRFKYKGSDKKDYSLFGSATSGSITIHHSAPEKVKEEFSKFLQDKIIKSSDFKESYVDMRAWADKNKKVKTLHKN